MADSTGSKVSEENLKSAYHDKEAIQAIMDAWNLSFEDAVRLWGRFIGTLEKAKEISDELS